MHGRSTTIDNTSWAEAQDPKSHGRDESLLELWRGLVSGRWTLLDTFDVTGERMVVARRNDPAVPTSKRLSTREQQVARLLCAGRSPKDVAYELGLSYSTVTTLMSRARRRLGARSLAHLLELADSNASPKAAKRQPDIATSRGRARPARTVTRTRPR